MTIRFNDMNSLKGGVFAIALLLLSVSCFIGLNTALSFAGHAAPALSVHFLATSRSYTATMEINDKAEVVWGSMVSLAKKKNPNNLRIKEENKEKLKFEATKITENDEILWGSLKVTPLSATSCKLIFTATMGGGKPLEKEMKNFVMDTIMQYCETTGLSCKIAK